ncbi:MAG: endonuclease III [Alistipes sp.]
MTIKARYAGVIAWFEENMPTAETELHYGSAYELLVAVILSAQCTDKRINATTPALFAAYPTPQALAQATAEEIYPYIKSVSYPNNKAKNLAAMARMLCTEFQGEIPQDLDQMQRLPGVGRKTANVLGAVLWQKEVMPVDTHVFRLSNRIGLTNCSKTPLQTELILEKNIPAHLLPLAHHWLILHGRYVCTARSPKCKACGIALWCRSFAENQKEMEKHASV